MPIREATPQDLDAIMAIVQAGKDIMAASGNPSQWKGDYPDRAQFLSDMERGECYVLEEGQIPQAVFVLAIGEEPYYAIIQDGSWPNDRPYGTIHRLASNGKVKGVFPQMVEFCLTKIPTLRIDTHRDNGILQHLALKHGFQFCGTVFLPDGDPRLAYQLDAAGDK